MPLEFDALIRRQLVVTVARDEVDELLTRDVRLGGQGILRSTWSSDRQLGGASMPGAWWAGSPIGATSQYTLIASFAVVSVSISSL